MKMPTQSQNIVKRFVYEVWNKSNMEALKETIAPKCVHYSSGLAEPTIGPEGYKKLMETFTAAFPDRRMKIIDTFQTGPKICLRWSFSGTHLGSFAGEKPTGRKVTFQGVGVIKVQRGKIRDVHSIFDTNELISQLKP